MGGDLSLVQLPWAPEPDPAPSVGVAGEDHEVCGALEGQEGVVSISKV